MQNGILKKNRAGVFELRWSEKTGDRWRTKTRSTGARDRAEASRVVDVWKAAEVALTRIERVPTVKELADAYLLSAAQRRVGKTTLDNVRKLVLFFGKLRPAEITDAKLAEYRLHRKVKDATLRREINTLIAILNNGIRKRLVPTAEVPHVDLPPEGQSRERYLDADAEERFMNDVIASAIAGELPLPLYLFIWIAIRTGARKGAILGLTWDRVDMKALQIDFREAGKTKTKKRRVPVPMDDKLFKILKLRARSSGRVIERDISKDFRRWTARNGWEWVTPHVLRHTAATRWLNAGISVWKVAGLLGDTVETVTRVYGHHATAGLEDIRGL